jgi:hypothetical protein
MTIATKSGGLILKDGKLATNCACCGDGICSCVSNMPTSFKLRFKDIVFQYLGSDNNITDQSGYETELADFYELYEITVPRTGVSIGFGANYQSNTAGCFNSTDPCVATNPCAGTRIDGSPAPEMGSFDFSFTVTCAGFVTNFRYFFQSQPACWEFYPNNRFLNFLTGAGGYRSQPIPYSFCDDGFQELLADAPNNPGSLDFVQSLNNEINYNAYWSRPFFTEPPGTSTRGFYNATSGKASFTPLFDNPLP